MSAPFILHAIGRGAAAKAEPEIDQSLTSDLHDPIRRVIVGARVKLLMEKPFIGQLATRLELVDATKWCGTAATDGRRLYYNREFFKALKPKEVMFVVGHEILHCIFEHFVRRGNRDAKLFNMACDYVVNYMLVHERIGEMPKRNGENIGLYDEKYTDEMSSEEVYDLLVQNSVVIKLPLDMHLDLRRGKAQGDGDGDDDQDQDQGGEGGSAAGDDQDDQNGGGGGGRTVEVRVMGEDGPPKLSEAEIEEIKREMKADLLRVAQSLGAGRIPKGLRRLIDGLTKSKLDWRTLLDSHIRSSVIDDYTFEALNPRNPPGILLPSDDVMDTVECACAIDMSGSISQEDAKVFLSEVRGIMQTFREFKLHLWTFDTQVYGYKTFSQANADELLDYHCHGGGGTLFEANWEFMKQKGLEIPRFVMFTDGLPNASWGDPNYVDTLFVIKGNENIVAPFGLTAYYDDPKKLKKAKAAFLPNGDLSRHGMRLAHAARGLVSA